MWLISRNENGVGFCCQDDTAVIPCASRIIIHEGTLALGAFPYDQPRQPLGYGRIEIVSKEICSDVVQKDPLICDKSRQLAPMFPNHRWRTEVVMYAINSLLVVSDAPR